MPGVTKPGTGLCADGRFYDHLPHALRAGQPARAQARRRIEHGLVASRSAGRLDTPAITTHGYQNHAVRSDAWRYIRYADGGEELYDEAKDPYEWTNLAAKPEFADAKAELAKWLPTKNVLPKKSGRAGRGDANLTRPVAAKRKPKKSNPKS